MEQVFVFVENRQLGKTLFWCGNIEIDSTKYSYITTLNHQTYFIVTFNAVGQVKRESTLKRLSTTLNLSSMILIHDEKFSNSSLLAHFDDN